MNIVRGVAGLLRRSSTTSSVESLPDEQRQLRFEENSWPEIEFSRDVDDERVLGSLWERYKELSLKSEAIAEAEQALADFLKYFLKSYETWVPEELLLGSDQSFSVKEKCIILGCKSGHPTRVIAGLTIELKGVTGVINKLNDATDQELNQFSFDGKNDLLHVLAILTRAAHNRQIFKVSEGLQTLVNLMKAMVVQLKRVVGGFTMEETVLSTAGKLSLSLQAVLIHVITIVSHFIQAETSDLDKISAEHESVVQPSPENVEDHLSVSRKASSEKFGTAPLMETGGLNWFVELLRIVRMLRVSGTLLDSSLQQLTLTTLRAALRGNLRAQNHYRSLGGIDVLVDAIGSTSSSSLSGANSKEWWSPEDFQIQVLSLEVLREAVFRNLSCLQYLYERGGADKFVEVIVWAAFISPTQVIQEQEKEINVDNVEGWNPQVSQLCNILCSFLVPSGDIRGFVMGLSGSHDAVGIVGSYWELATRWIVKVLLGIFKDMKSLQVPRPCSTTLQHYTLYVFKKLLAASPAVLTLFHEERLWEVMFSEHFFYFDMDAKVLSGERRQESCQGEVIPTLLDFSLCDESIDSEPLRLEVISFVELAATGSCNFNNGPECYALMKALELCAGIPTVATMIVKSLHRILQLAPDQTVCAFKNLEALLLLSQVMDIQRQEYIKFAHLNGNQSSVEDVLEDDGTAKILTFKETWKLSREAVFDLFAEYVLTSEEARIVSLHSTKTMQVFFDLLWDAESRKFALGHILDLMKLPPTSGDDQEAKLELCIRYLETLSQSDHEGKPKDINVLIDLLSGIREVLETDHVYYQTLFQEAECFVHIVSLLNENLSEQHGKLLCLSVIQTLRLLLSGNGASKNAFRSLVGAGYTTLQTLFLNSYQGSPNEELLSALLDMLVDGSFNIPGNMTIQNEDTIVLFFTILRQSCETLQLYGLLTFNRVVEESTANKVACVNAGLLNFLLDWFDNGVSNNLITKLAVLIEAIGRHSVTGKDMRKIFSLLRNSNQASNPANRHILLDVIQGMLKEDGPAVFFEMSGRDSGIMITTSLRLPSAKGFTFSCWMRVEGFPVAESANNRESFMGLFTFLTESGKGYNAMIGQESLVVEILGQKAQPAILNLNVQPKRWCHLCVTHSVGRALSGGSILRVYIDGSLAASDKLRYPKLSEPMIKSTLGTHSNVSFSDGVVDDTKFSFPFCGQLGPIYMFDDSLSHDQIKAIFQAGSGYMYSFLPTEIGCIPESMASNSIFDLKEGLSSKVVFGFNAQASSGRTICDVASNFDGTTEKVPHEAVIMGGTRLCYRHLLKDIIDCVGGVAAFFPLLTQLDQVHLLRGFSLEQEESDNTHSPIISNVYVAAEVIELITLVLDNNSAHQEYMCQNKGMSVIGSLLQSVSPQHLTTGVASALVHLLAVVSKRSGTGVARQLVEDTLLKIFLNLNIWIYTPYMVQRELLIALLNHCESEVGLAQDFVSLPKILDLVQQFFWDRPKNRRLVGTKRILHPVTKDVIGERPGREEVGKLRILLLSLAEVAVRDSISMPDTKALLAYMTKSEDPVCLEDVLHMLLRLLGRKEFAAAFVENIQILGGCQLFLGLLERQEEPLRLLGLQIIGLLLISIPNEKKGSWLLSITAGVGRPAYEHQRAERAKIASLFVATTERLIVFPFTDMLCATLFDVLLGGASLKQVLRRGMGFTQEPAGQKDTSNSSQFVLPQVLGILMRFLLVCKKSETRVGVMRDILRLLEANPSSSEAIVLEPSWQCWLFDLLIDIQESEPEVENQGDSCLAFQEEEMIIHGIFTIIHCFCIYRVRGGWRHLERTVNFVHIYAEKGLLLKFDLLRRIYADLLEALLQARSEERGQMSQPCRDNTLYVMNLVDELLVKEIVQVLPFPKDEVTESMNESFVLLSSSNTKVGNAYDHDRPCIEMRTQDKVTVIKDEDWQIYNKLWDVLRDMHGRGRGDYQSGPSLGQRARGLVESINIPAAEMAAAVVAGGLGAVVSMNPGKLIDKAMKLRGEKFPRVVFHLVVLYIYKGALEAASSCVHQFLSLLPLFLSSESEQCRNRLQLFMWCLLEARTQLALVDNGARFHLISQLLRETMEQGKNMLAASMLDKNDINNDVTSVQSVLQQDRIINAVKEEKYFLGSVMAERSNEVYLVKSEIEEAEGLGKANLKFLEDQLQSTLLSLRASDTSRTIAVQMLDEEDQQAVSNQWCHMFRRLTNERGPWSTIPFPSEIQISWKLDKTEDPWRRRLKLKRNYHFKEQLGHSQEGCETAITSAAASEKVSNFETFLETSKLLLKGLRGISEEEASDLTDEDKVVLDDDDDDFEPNVAGMASPEPSNIEEMVSASGPLEQSTIKGEEAFIEEVLHSSVCVLVTPKRKLAGRLDVTADCLHFYGDFLVEGTGGSSVFTSSGQINCAEHVPLDLFEKGMTKGRTETRDGSKEHVNLEAGKRSSQDRVDSALPGVVSHQGLKSIKRHHRWDLSKVKAVHGTRYLLQYTALEIFFDSSIPPVFLNLPSQKLAKDIGLKILSLRSNSLSGKGNFKEKPENKYFVDKRLALELAERYRDCWRRREINNFEYLMQLNTLAGRSYNDLTQYPIFPWIISDYMSEGLDLASASSFRDLSKPIGALDERRFEVFEERFRNFSDPDIPSFYYGSHYSSMGIVLFYLLRLEPFTSLHRNLQGGKFDHADRLFHSIEGAFKNCMANTSDVKELIPEFFYMPDFLVNSNKYQMGIKQDGEQLDNVVLPRWAKGSTEEFVLKNREALESEYVSQHLHQWIDLIFGYKQRGRPAVEAANVFYHLTYEGAVDLESLEDRLQRAAVEDQIANFGQTPMQLFRKKHPQRGPPMPISRPLYYAPASITLTSSVPANMLTPSAAGEKQKALLFVGIVDNKVVLVTSELKVLLRNWLTASQTGGNFTFSSSQDPFFAIGAEVSQPYKIKGPLAENIELAPWCFQTIQVRTSSYLIMCGFWDNSFRIMSLSDGSFLQSNRQHKDVVSCLAVSSDGSILVTGSHDTTVMVWEIDLSLHGSRRPGLKDAASTTDRSGKWDNIMFDKPRHVLSGHDDIVTCVAVSVELDLVVSGSRDSSCILHTLREGRYVQSIQHPFGSSISRLVVSKHGLVVLFSKDDLIFLLYSVNGKHLASSDSNGRINCIELSNCGEFLVCGGDQGQVVVRSIYTLEVVRRYEGTNMPILSLSVTSEDCFLAGLQDGGLLIYSIERPQQKRSNILQSLRTRSS